MYFGTATENRKLTGGPHRRVHKGPSFGRMDGVSDLGWTERSNYYTDKQVILHQGRDLCWPLLPRTYTICPSCMRTFTCHFFCPNPCSVTHPHGVEDIEELSQHPASPPLDMSETSKCLCAVVSKGGHKPNDGCPSRGTPQCHCH